jgi:hypothetical protein
MMPGMALSNAEKQKRWRDRRNKLAREASRLRNAPLDLPIADRIKRGKLTADERRLAVQLLLKNLDRDDDAELIAWLRSRR